MIVDLDVKITHFKYEQKQVSRFPPRMSTLATALTWKRTLLPSRSFVCQRELLMGLQGLGSSGTSWPISSTPNCSTVEVHGLTLTPGDSCFTASCMHSPGSAGKDGGSGEPSERENPRRHRWTEALDTHQSAE